MESSVTAVLVESDATLRRVLGTVLERCGLAVVSYGERTAVLEHILAGKPCQILLIDFEASVAGGAALVATLRNVSRERRPFLTVGLGSGAVDARAIDGEVVACFLAKPLDVELIGRVFGGIAASLARAGLTVRVPLDLPPGEVADFRSERMAGYDQGRADEKRA